MGDFLGSYYTNFLEDEGMSGGMALLKAEQPVSILEMEKLIASRQAEGFSNEIGRHNSSSSGRRVCAIDGLHTRDGKDIDFCRAASQASSLDNPDLDIPVASMSLFEQDSMMVSVRLQSLKDKSKSSKRESWRDTLRIRSRSSTEFRDKPVEITSSRAQTTNFDILTPAEDGGSTSSKTPRSGDVFLSVGKRTAKLKTSLLNLIGRKKKKHERSTKQT